MTTSQSKAAIDKIMAAKDNPQQLQQALDAARGQMDQATLDKITAAKGNPAKLQQALQEAKTKGEQAEQPGD